MTKLLAGAVEQANGHAATSAAKAAMEENAIIAALKRCATQKLTSSAAY